MDDTNCNRNALSIQYILSTQHPASVLHNNVHYCLNAIGQGYTVTGTTLNAIATTAGTWAAQYAGRRWLADDHISPAVNPIDTAFATNSVELDILTPGAGSNLVGAATGKSSPFDFYRNARPSSGRDIGAVEQGA